MITYLEAVEQSKNLIKKNDANRFEICKLCLSVCEIKHGGSKMHGLKTIKDFSKDIGINEKTLSNWINVYRNFYKKLDARIRDKYSWSEYLSASKKMDYLRIDKNNKNITDVLSQRFLTKTNKTILRYSQDLNALHYNFVKKNIFAKIDRKIIQKIYEQVSDIKYTIDQEDISFKKDYIESKNKCSVETLTPKDREIFNFIKKNNSVRLCDITSKLHPNEKSLKTRNTAWAWRSVSKLIEKNLVKKAENKKYIAV